MRLMILAGCVLSGMAFGQAKGNPEAEKAAEASADSWLKLVDGEKYVESHAEAASIFKGAITADAWKTQASGVRGPLGKLVSRKVKSRTYAEKLPGAPDGKYVVILYDVKYEKKAEGIETVTPMLDKDGKWRVSGYFLK